MIDVTETSESGYNETHDYDISLNNKHSPEKMFKIKGGCDPMEGTFLKNWYEKHPQATRATYK